LERRVTGDAKRRRLSRTTSSENQRPAARSFVGRLLKDLLAKRGIMVSHDTVWRFLRREGQSFKKNALRD
jgi:transposase